MIFIFVIGVCISPHILMFAFSSLSSLSMRHQWYSFLWFVFVLPVIINVRRDQRFCFRGDGLIIVNDTSYLSVAGLLVFFAISQMSFPKCSGGDVCILLCTKFDFVSYPIHFILLTVFYICHEQCGLQSWIVVVVVIVASFVVVAVIPVFYQYHSDDRYLVQYCTNIYRQGRLMRYTGIAFYDTNPFVLLLSAVIVLLLPAIVPQYR